MVKVGRELYCTYMASELKDATYLEDRLNTLAKSCDLYYNNEVKDEVKPNPFTTQICYAFNGIANPKDVYVFPSEGNILGIANLDKGQKVDFKFSNGTRTVFTLEETTFTIFRSYLDTPKIEKAKCP